ncbi:MAG: hypothetical protein HY690_08500 [Chloroflexi bacterium]|nr:hypothetical protein [Chloroflexota bacterium]
MPGPGPRGPQRRPISPSSPLEGRQLWRVGDWGGASEQIGRRWEVLGAEELRGLLGQPRPGPDGRPYTPRAAAIISAERALAEAVHRSGKPHADALLVGTVDEAPVLEPVDFKWTLETAELRQVGKEVLEALLANPPPLLAERLAQALAEAGCPLDRPPRYHTGFFLAPDYPPNRAQLAPRGSLDPDMVVLCPVDGLTFFSPLLGWEVAQALASADHSLLDRLEVVERYYRLGAGVLGALRRLRSGIFAEQLIDLDGVAELADLRAQHRLRTTAEVVAYLDRALRARAELVERLQQIERAVYPFSALRQEVARRGPAALDDRRLGRLHGEIMKRVRAELWRAGRRLVAEGQTEQQALVALEALGARFTRLAQREADLALSSNAAR